MATSTRRSRASTRRAQVARVRRAGVGLAEAAYGGGFGDRGEGGKRGTVVAHPGEVGARSGWTGRRLSGGSDEDDRRQRLMEGSIPLMERASA